MVLALVGRQIIGTRMNYIKFLSLRSGHSVSFRYFSIGERYF